MERLRRRDWTLIVAEQTKVCTGCREAKPLEEFHRSSGTKDGLQYRCKSCQRAWREENREREQETRRRYYQENRDQLLTQRRKHRAENPHGDWESDYRKRSRAAGCIPVVRSFTREELVAYWGNGARCIYCDGPFEEIDHLQPIALGGVHAVETVVPSCSQCNQEGGKHARSFLWRMNGQERYREVVVGAARARLAPIA